MKTKNHVLEKIEEYFIISAGTLIMAAGIYFFKFPNNFTTGGVSGLATILGSVFPVISKGTFVTTINILFLIIGFLFLGKSFAFKTVYSSMLLSLSINVMEYLMPMSATFTDQRFVELIVSVGLCAIGSSLVFARRASTGGTDIAAMILKKITALDTGKALLCSDAVIAFASGLVFDIETCMFSVVGLAMKALLVDNVIGQYQYQKVRDGHHCGA